MVKISVIVPVCNVEKYLPRCLDCLVGQSLKDIEIICVDDGSSDGSGAVLDGYAKRDARIRVIHQDNSGAGAARNAGMDQATGEYLFFFDPDDSCSRKMLAGMYARAKKTKADIVIAGKVTVSAETGKIVSKYGFHRDIWRYRQPFSSVEVRDLILALAKSVPWDKLFRHEFIRKQGIRFQNTRRCNDVLFVDMALVLAERIALQPRAYYRYTLNRKGSLQSNKDNSPLVFLDAYRALEDSLRSRGLFGIFGDSYARVFLTTALFNLLHFKESENVRTCYKMVRQTLLRLKEEVDLSHDSLLSMRYRLLHEFVIRNEDCHVFMSAAKRGALRRQEDDDDDTEKTRTIRFSVRSFVRRYLPIPFREAIKRVRVMFLHRVSSVGKVSVEDAVKNCGDTRLDFIDIAGEEIRLTVSYRVIGSRAPDALPFDEGVPVRIVPGDEFSSRIEGMVVSDIVRGRRFTVIIDRTSLPISFSSRNITFGSYCGLVPKRGGAFFCRDGVMVRHKNGSIEFCVDSFGRRIVAYVAYIGRVFVKPHAAEFRALFLRICAWFVRKLARRPIWLVSDRPDRADDNGRAFFEYVSSLPRAEVPARCVFAIDRHCPDYGEMRKIGKVVDMSGWWYKVLFLSSDFVISAYRTRYQRMPFGNRTADFLMGFFARRYRFVYLRHGISLNDQSDDICRTNLNARLLISAARSEYESILGGRYGYGAREVRLCGMTRYDKLYDAPGGYITIMPTWRTYLTAGAGTNRLLDRATFSNSDFCLNYRGLLSDEEFVSDCLKHGFRVRLMMHPNMRDSIDELKVCPQIEILSPEVSYREVFATSNLVVTDYSSVAFDFAYLKKPVVYFQFDRARFYGDQYKAGYFDMEKDGFGEVEIDLPSLKKRVLAYAENGCRMKRMYLERVERFFAFTDKNNCRRVFEAICAASREDSAS